MFWGHESIKDKVREEVEILKWREAEGHGTHGTHGTLVIGNREQDGELGERKRTKGQSKC